MSTTDQRLMQVLLAPTVSEKSTYVGEKNNQVVFRVVQDATKPEIKAAVELLFKVKVKGVQVSNVKGKEKRWVEDGPFAETKELIAGFWIIEVASKEEAIAWALKAPHPHFDDGETNIELRQIFEMDDFGESEAVDKMRDLKLRSMS